MTKLKLIIIFAFILTGLILSKDTDMEKKKKDFPVLKGPYLGQKPPGMKPEIFVPCPHSCMSPFFILNLPM